MSAIRIALTELRRLTAGRMLVLAMVALILVPTLYAGLYLYASYDPYGGLSRVPAALVLDDEPATLDGEAVRLGEQVADELEQSGDFDWHRMSAQAAREGVKEGRFYFALQIPEDFSASLTSPARLDPHRARLTMTTNDANSYLSRTIADTVTDKVRDTIAERVGRRAATEFLLGIADVRGTLVGMRDGVARLRKGTDQSSAAAEELTHGAGRLADGARELSAGLDTLLYAAAPLPTDTRRLAESARQVAVANRKAADAGDRAAGIAGDLDAAFTERRAELVELLETTGLTVEQRGSLLERYDELKTPLTEATGEVQSAARRLDELADGAAEVADGVEGLAGATPRLVSGAEEARDGADRLRAGAGRLNESAGTLGNGLDQLSEGSRELLTGLDGGIEQLPDIDEEIRDRIATTVGDPVEVQDQSQATASTYGAGLAPFFLALAAWIGGYALFLLVRPLSTRALAANRSPLRIALGGWLAAALLGAAQMAVVLTVVSLGVGIDPGNAAMTFGFLLLVSLSFIAIVHCLNVWFGAAGLFLGLALMVLQLVTAGGTFPWQTIPEPLHPLHHALPMSYAVDGLRHLMYGGMSGLVLRDALIVAAWLVGALALTTLATRRQRWWTPQRIRPELTL